MENSYYPRHTVLRQPTGHPLRQQILGASRRAQIASEDQDIKLFALSFTAFFVCIYTFIF